MNKKKKEIEDSTDPSTFCCESTMATACIQCQGCGLWAHYECADVDKHVFAYICELLSVGIALFAVETYVKNILRKVRNSVSDFKPLV